MSTLRVLILIEYPTRLGGENSLLAILQHLVPHLELKILLPSHSPLIPFLEVSGIDYLTYQFSEGDTLSNQSARLCALNSLLIEFRPHIIHGNSLSMGKFLGRHASTLQPAIITAHIRDIINLRHAEIKALNQCVHLVCVSHATRLHLLAQGVHPDQASVIHNGIDADYKPQSGFSTQVPTSIRNELGLPIDVKIALFVGQIGLRKGIEHVLQAFHLLSHLPEFATWHLLIVGSRFSQKTESIDYEQKLHQFIRSHHLEHRIHFLGYREDVPFIISSSNLLVHPALQEPFGRVLLEACISKLPIIATNVGGTQEIIEHGVSGFLVEPGNSQAIAQVWKSLLLNQCLMHQMGEAAYNHVSRNLTTKASADALLHLWTKLWKNQRI